jgi:hypothetical protein
MQKRAGLVTTCVIGAVIAWMVYNHLTAVSGRTDIQGRLTIDLPRGSHHRMEQGVDTSVGSISLGGTQNTLEYDIGHLAGNYAAYDDREEFFVWHKQDVNDEIVMDYALRNVDGRQTLLVSFPDLGPANFWSDVHDSSEIDAILGVMRTVRPSPRD